MYRICFGAVWTEARSLADAQDIALTEARALTRACGFPVEAKVFRVSGTVIDAAGHRVTPHHIVGTAVVRIEHQNAFVGWQSAPSIKVAASFRNGNVRQVADDVICDGQRALELALLLEPHEVERLIRAVAGDGLRVMGETGGPVQM